MSRSPPRETSRASNLAVRSPSYRSAGNVVGLGTANSVQIANPFESLHQEPIRRALILCQLEVPSQGLHGLGVLLRLEVFVAGPIMTRSVVRILDEQLEQGLKSG